MPQAEPIPGRPTPLPDGLAERLRAIVGTPGLIDDPALMGRYVEDHRKRYPGTAALVVRPAATAEVAAVVAVCAAAGVAIVPQGGNTGLVAGGIPDASGREIVLSLSRMTAVRAIDPINNTLTVEAGRILADVQTAAAALDRLFPLSLAAEGSCTIGGNLSTNAGGTQVLRYGSARDLVLGLEVVLADGRVLNGLKGLRKDNTGYDLKQIFLGSEGTLGIITAATLKLFPRPHDVVTAWVGIPHARAAIDLLTLAQSESGGLVTTWEYMPHFCVDLVLRHLPGHRLPLAAPHPAYLLIELATSGQDSGVGATLERILAEGSQRAWVADATVAASVGQAKALWAIREEMPEAERREGSAIKHDTAVPISAIPDFLQQATAAAEAVVPGVRISSFGHIGDGNIHFNVLPPKGADPARFLEAWDRVNQAVEGVAMGHGGSFSAEHGVGRAKQPSMVRYKSPLELELMWRLKTAFDPQGLLNPGRVVAR
ncbi:MAG: FAD-binding oxidoreductase [Alphaproteobacteria bacterium]|nr:FAD-binding oxidoreductase [Alphaproteobacteria bacterium]